VLPARGDEDVSGAQARQIGVESGGAGGVVEDEQPARGSLQLGPDRLDEGGLVGRGGIEAERRGKAGVAGSEGGGFLGAEPADQVVVGEVGVGIAEGELGLADTTKARDRPPRLGDGSAAAFSKPAGKFFEFILATDEAGAG
jgi:hypothetical protein